MMTYFYVLSTFTQIKGKTGQMFLNRSTLTICNDSGGVFGSLKEVGLHHSYDGESPDWNTV